MRAVVVLTVLLSACAVPADVAITSEPLVLAPGDTVVSLTFDDTLANHLLAAQLASDRGLRATFYINSARVDRPGSIAHADLLALEAAGHELGGHTIDHADLPTLSPDDERRQICDDRVALIKRGYRVTSFAYPFGAEDVATREAVAACGYNSARDVGGLSGSRHANAVPPAQPYLVRTHASVKATTTLAELQSYVTGAEEHGGGWVPLVFHHVCDGCNPLAISPALLAEFLDWLATRPPTTSVATVHEVIGGDMQPPIAGPPLPPPPGPTNLLVNPSLEVDANADGLADCWQKGGTGVFAATHTRTSGSAADGMFAHRIDVTSVAAGGAVRLVSRQDTGACAPPAVAGHRYTVTARYRASGSPRFTLYTRSATGTWSYFAQSPVLPSSSVWAQTTYTSGPLPAGATAISVGLSIYAAGTLEQDLFTLIDADAAPPPPVPTARITAPAEGAIVSGIAPILTEVGGDAAITRVRFYLDGVQLGTRTVAPWKWNWNTAGTTPGPHILAIQAENAAGGVTRSGNVTVTVASPQRVRGELLPDSLMPAGVGSTQ